MRHEEPRGFGHLLPIATARLALRPFELADGPALYALHSDPEVTRYAGGLKNRAESDAILRRLIQRLEGTGFGLLAVEDKDSKLVIGWCGVQQMRHLDGYEVIYALRQDRWGQGLALEASLAILEHAFGVDGLDGVHGLVFPENVRSIRVLEKLGMSYVSSVLDSETKKRASVYRVGRSDFLSHLSSSK